VENPVTIEAHVRVLGHRHSLQEVSFAWGIIPMSTVVISGPSGVGKDSVLKRMKERGIPFHYVVTATTRPPRPGERHGVDYYFVSPAEFARMIEEDELMEWSIVYGDYKGIPKRPIMAH